MTRHLVAAFAAVISVSLLATASAHAGTCSFNGSSGVLTVDSQGDFNDLQVVSGAIQLNGSACGGATTTSTARIVIVGEDGDVDKLTLIGTFAPGRNDTPETDDPDIEIEVTNFDDDNDWLIVKGNAQRQVWRFTAGGLRLNGDPDADVVLPARGRITLYGYGGNDVIDARAYAGDCTLGLRGGTGNDRITGSAGADTIHGEDGDDTLVGGAGDDTFDDGPGDDLVRGGPGDDVMWGQGTVVDGTDDFQGGTGQDEVAYLLRSGDLTVTIDGVANDGAPGENDNVHLDVEMVATGDGDDLLIGSSGDDILDGGDGANELYGGAGDDWLDAGIGDVACIAFGEEGDDVLEGSFAGDTLDGGPGNDRLEGYSGNDTLYGGAGLDRYFGGFGNDVIFNDDGVNETVNCGEGTDDPEPSAGDTFVACENI